MRPIALRLAALLLLSGWTVCRLGAQTILINNAGFEEDVLDENEVFDSTVTPAGWSTYDPTGVLDRDYSDVGVLKPAGTQLYGGTGAPEGSNVALIFLWPQSGADYNQPVGLQQTLGATLQSFTRYTLTVQVGNIAVDGAAAFNLNGFPGYRVELLAGTTLLAQDNNTLTPGEGQFARSSVEYTTDDLVEGGSLVIRLLNLNAPDSGIEVNYDDVQLTATVIPEPSTYATLAGLAALALVLATRRRPRRL
jgi:hypothetical protein